MPKPILVLDFDGVCTDYRSGWQGVDVCPDPPVEGLWAFLELASPHFDLQVFSARSSLPSGRIAMRRWVLEWGKVAGYVMSAPRTWECVAAEDADGLRRWTLTLPAHKPPAFLTLDDRAMTFHGVWPTLDVLQAFEPWTRHGPPPWEGPRETERP